jgi:hypothetical protein
MKNRVTIDLLIILVIYAVYFAIIYLITLPDVNLPSQLGVTPALSGGQQVAEQDFLDQFNWWAMLVMGVSLVCMLGWYVLVEWAIRPHRATSGTFALTWLILLVIVIATGIIAFMFGPQASENPYVLALFYVLSGVVFFYLASVCCSPTNAKYLIPPARQIRRW